MVEDVFDGSSQKNCELPLSYYLTALNMTLSAPGADRADVLFNLAMASEGRGKELTSPYDSPNDSVNGKYDRSSSENTQNCGMSEADEVLLEKEIAQLRENLPQVEYIPASSYQGSKSGYVFTKGDGGMGYHKDTYGVTVMENEARKSYKKKIVLKRRQKEREMDGQSISISTASTIVSNLANSCQIPADRRVRSTGIKFPWELFRAKTSQEMVDSFRKDIPELRMRGELVKDETYFEQFKNLVGFKSDSTGDNGNFDKEEAEYWDGKTISKAQFRDMILGSNVCAWGECFRRRR